LLQCRLRSGTENNLTLQNNIILSVTSWILAWKLIAFFLLSLHFN